MARLDLKKSWLVRTAQGLFLLNAVIWLGLAGWSAARISSADPDQRFISEVMALLILGNAAGMFFCGLFVTRRSRFLYAVTLAFLAINLLLTITDQVGLWDWITLGIDLILGVVLVAIKIFPWQR